MITPNITLIQNFLKYPNDLLRYFKHHITWDQRLKARKTACFGIPYNYSGITYPKTPMHKKLVSLCEKIEQQIGFYPNNCLLNYYPDGNSSMGYHSDSSETLKLGTGVVIITLGAQRKILYKNKEDRSIIYEYALCSGDLLYMDNEIQKLWLHAIPKQEQVGERISLSFREIIE